MDEEWRDICEFDGKYQVSNRGEVRNIKFIGHARSEKQERILAQRMNRYGYMVVHLSNGKNDFYPTVHRLVASAFIENPLGLQIVNHKDENKQNNSVDNLEWCTAKHNANYGTAPERVGKSHKKAILQISKDTGETICEYASASDAAVALCGTKSKNRAITSCARGEKRSAYGFVWKYKEGEGIYCQLA